MIAERIRKMAAEGITRGAIARQLKLDSDLVYGVLVKGYWA